MPIVAQGSFNPLGQPPDAFVVIVPPPPFMLGVATNILGIVGTASWGPVNAAQVLGNAQQMVATFGDMTAASLTDPLDLPTAAYIAFLQAASQASLTVVGVRVTDGTDVAASAAIKDSGGVNTGVTITGLYTGSRGNVITVTVAAGQAANTFDVTVAAWQGAQSEVYRGIGGSGNAFWVNLANAINTGLSSLRPKSAFVTAVAGTGTLVPTLATTTLAGGADGRAASQAQVLGSDSVTPKTGIFALRNQGASVAIVASGMPATTAWPTIQSFADSEGVIFVLNIAAGTSTGTAISTLQTAAIQDYNIVVINEFGRFFDTVNNVLRSVPLAPYYAGLLATLSPEQSPLNKPIRGLVATDRSSSANPYTEGELGQLTNAGIEVIVTPIPRGNLFGPRIGRNTQVNNLVQAPAEYGRMTNYLAQSFSKTIGQFVGELQSTSPQDPLRRRVSTLGNQFLSLLQRFGQIDTFRFTCDLTNNTPATIAQHFLFAFARVRYLASVWWFVLSLQGGTTVITQAASLGQAIASLPSS